MCSFRKAAQPCRGSWLISEGAGVWGTGHLRSRTWSVLRGEVVWSALASRCLADVRKAGVENPSA